MESSFNSSYNDISVNKKVEEMTQRAAQLLNEVKEKEIKQDVKVAKSNCEIQEGMAEEDFFDLSKRLDKFQGRNTSVTINIDIYDKIKKYAEIKNLTINYFINKLIKIGIKEIELLSVEEVQRSMCFCGDTKSIPFNLDDTMNDEFEYFISDMKKKGYKFSRNTLICALVRKNLDRFY